MAHVHKPSAVQPGTALWRAVYRSTIEQARRLAQMRGKLKRLGLHREPRAVRLLDLCCGQGELLEILHGMGFSDLSGVEIDGPPASSAKAGFTILEGNALDTGLDADSYDVVTCLHALHHLPRPDDVRQFLTEAFRLLRPGGRLYILDFHRSVELRLALEILRRNRTWAGSRRLANQSTLVREEWPLLRQYLGGWNEIRRHLDGGGFERIFRKRSLFYFYLGLRKPFAQEGR